MCRNISASVDGGAKRRVSHAQTRERGPPSALVEFFVIVVVLLLLKSTPSRIENHYRSFKICTAFTLGVKRVTNK